MPAYSNAFTGHFAVERPVAEAFLLFSPLGERAWAGADWNPELLHPPGVDWAEGQVFRTTELYGDAVWIVSELDGEDHRVRYYRVEPALYVVRIDVACRENAVAGTSVTVTYEYVSLSPEGDATIAAMTQAEYDGKMKSWDRDIRQALG